MSLPATVRGTETGHSQLEHLCKLSGKFTFVPAIAWNDNTAKHLSLHRKIVNMPMQRFSFSTVTFKPGRQILLRTAHIPIYSLLKVNASKPANINILCLWQIKNCDVYSTIQQFIPSSYFGTFYQDSTCLIKEYPLVYLRTPFFTDL